MKKIGQSLCIFGLIGFVAAMLGPGLGEIGFVLKLVRAISGLAVARGLLMWVDYNLKEKKMNYARNNVPFPKKEISKNSVMHVLLNVVTIICVIAMGTWTLNLLSEKETVVVKDAYVEKSGLRTYVRGVLEDGSSPTFKIEGLDDEEVLELSLADSVVITYYSRTGDVYNIKSE